MAPFLLSVFSKQAHSRDEGKTWEEEQIIPVESPYGYVSQLRTDECGNVFAVGRRTVLRVFDMELSRGGREIFPANEKRGEDG
jgi:hypothetical protein